MIKDLPAFFRSFLGGKKILPTNYIAVQEIFSFVALDVKKFSDNKYEIYLSIKGLNVGIKIPLTIKQFRMLNFNINLLKKYKSPNSKNAPVKENMSHFYSILHFIPNMLYLYYLAFFSGTSIFKIKIPTSFESIDLSLEAKLFQNDTIFYFIKVVPFGLSKVTFSYENILTFSENLERIEAHLSLDGVNDAC